MQRKRERERENDIIMVIETSKIPYFHDDSFRDNLVAVNVKRICTSSNYYTTTSNKLMFFISFEGMGNGWNRDVSKLPMRKVSLAGHLSGMEKQSKYRSAISLRADITIYMILLASSEMGFGEWRDIEYKQRRVTAEREIRKEEECEGRKGRRVTKGKEDARCDESGAKVREEEKKWRFWRRHEQE